MEGKPKDVKSALKRDRDTLELNLTLVWLIKSNVVKFKTADSGYKIAL